MNKTPQKIVDGDKRCFLCNSAPPTNQRVKIFGKTKGVFIIYNRGWYRRETNLIEKNYATQLFG